MASLGPIGKISTNVAAATTVPSPWVGSVACRTTQNASSCLVSTPGTWLAVDGSGTGFPSVVVPSQPFAGTAAATASATYSFVQDTNRAAATGLLSDHAYVGSTVGGVYTGASQTSVLCVPSSFTPDALYTSYSLFVRKNNTSHYHARFDVGYTEAAVSLFIDEHCLVPSAPIGRVIGSAVLTLQVIGDALHVLKDGVLVYAYTDVGVSGYPTPASGAIGFSLRNGKLDDLKAGWFRYLFEEQFDVGLGAFAVAPGDGLSVVASPYGGYWGRAAGTTPATATLPRPLPPSFILEFTFLTPQPRVADIRVELVDPLTPTGGVVVHTDMARTAGGPGAVAGVGSTQFFAAPLSGNVRYRFCLEVQRHFGILRVTNLDTGELCGGGYLALPPSTTYTHLVIYPPTQECFIDHITVSPVGK